MGPGAKNEKSNRITLFELCKSWEANFWYVASLWGELKIWCGNFQNFDFLARKCIMCGSKSPFWPFWTAHNAFLDPKNENFENSCTRFLVCPTRMLHTKNQLPSPCTAQIKWCGSFFTLKFGDPFLTKNRYFWPISGQYLKKCDTWGQFLWFLVIFSIKVNY